jgi:hypothetical protein
MIGPGAGGPQPGLGRATSLAPAQASASLVQTLTALGAQVTTRTGDAVTGVVTEQQNPNMFLVIVLLIFCVLPGIVYLVIARRTVTFPFSIQLAPEGAGSRASVVGQGAGLRVAQQAVATLPVAPSP